MDALEIDVTDINGVPLAKVWKLSAEDGPDVGYLEVQAGPKLTDLLRVRVVVHKAGTNG